MRPAPQGRPLPLGQVETCHLAAPAASAENAPSFTTSNQRDAPPLPGPVLFAYDGSELAAFAIAHAATQLAPRRDALVLCVWQPANVGFTPAGTKRFNADQATEVRQAAERTAAHGASLAGKAGFLARSMAVEAAPTWQGIVQTAVQHNASLIATQGSVAAPNCAELTDRRRFRNSRQARVARARAASAFAWSHFTVAKGTSR